MSAKRVNRAVELLSQDQPVYYTGGKRFRWQATLSAKFFKWYFVEFPTGAE